MSEEDEGAWQDECFKLIRLIVAVINEYTACITDRKSKLGWALTDLRAVNHDLLMAIENADKQSTESLLLEARALMAEVIWLAGKDGLDD